MTTNAPLKPASDDIVAYKVLVVGDVNTGKTSIVRRCVSGLFSPNVKPTIGVDFALKIIPWADGRTIRLQLWDIAGQERFGKMTRAYYQDSVAAFVVFDATRQSSLEACKKWKNDIDAKITLSNNEPLPVVLLANKIDLIEEGDESWLSIEAELDTFCKQQGFYRWFKTSAKDNLGIDEATIALVEQTNLKVPPSEPEALIFPPRQNLQDSSCCGT